MSLMLMIDRETGRPAMGVCVISPDKAVFRGFTQQWKGWLAGMCDTPADADGDHILPRPEAERVADAIRETLDAMASAARRNPN